MANRGAIVDVVQELREGVDEAVAKVGAAVPTQGKAVSVRFAGGRVGLLDLTQPRSAVWLKVLHSLHEQQTPAYVEVEPRSRQITRLLQPTLQPVGEIEPVERGGDLRVNLLRSHAVHVLRRGNPRFDELRKLLQTARKSETPVWVTETPDSHEIIDVRPAEARTPTPQRRR
jgi:hypothetical protein